MCDEFGLRHRAFGGIDQQDDTVNHRKDAFDLAAEVGVTGGVDNVDARVVPGDGGNFRQDRNAAFAFQII